MNGVGGRFSREDVLWLETELARKTRKISPVKQDESRTDLWGIRSRA